MGSDPPQPTIDPATLRLGQQAEADKIDAIKDRVSDDTRNLLLRFGRRAGGPSSSSEGLSGPNFGMDSLGLFGGRKLELLRRMGKL